MSSPLDKGPEGMTDAQFHEAMKESARVRAAYLLGDPAEMAELAFKNPACYNRLREALLDVESAAMGSPHEIGDDWPNYEDAQT